jgi:hypothetical protein
MHTGTRLLMLVFPVLGACGTGDSSSRDASAADASRVSDAQTADVPLRPAPLPACKWPSGSVVSPDSGTVPWSASRATVECGACVTDPNGACDVGGSEGTTLCGDAASCLPCTLLCKPSEYGLIAFLGSGSAAAPNVPAGCRSIDPENGSAEGVYACCPCE